jgi:hypothetical protein
VLWHVLFEHVDHTFNTYACDIIEGTMKIHYILTTNKYILTQLLVKPLSCFCAFYINNMWVECPNVKWIGDWVSGHLQPTNIRFVRDFTYNVWDREW